jgi:hypothetical protein
MRRTRRAQREAAAAPAGTYLFQQRRQRGARGGEVVRRGIAQAGRGGRQAGQRAAGSAGGAGPAVLAPLLQRRGTAVGGARVGVVARGRKKKEESGRKKEEEERRKSRAESEARPGTQQRRKGDASAATTGYGALCAALCCTAEGQPSMSASGRQYDTIRMIRYDTIRYDTIRYDTIRYRARNGPYWRTLVSAGAPQLISASPPPGCVHVAARPRPRRHRPRPPRRCRCCSRPGGPPAASVTPPPRLPPRLPPQLAAREDDSAAAAPPWRQRP